LGFLEIFYSNFKEFKQKIREMQGSRALDSLGERPNCPEHWVLHLKMEKLETISRNLGSIEAIKAILQMLKKNKKSVIDL
jgi:hypothetical protein